MASKKQQQPKQNNGGPPSDWLDVDQRPEGYWDESQPLCGVVEGAREWINSRGRTTRAYRIRLLRPTSCTVALEGGGRDSVELSAGSHVGVFESAGLRSLEAMAGARVWIERTGTKSTKNGEMKTYIVRSPDIKIASSVKVTAYTPRRAPDVGEPLDNAPDTDELPF